MAHSSGADTVDPSVTDRRGLKVLCVEECRRRLREAVVGRVGFLRDREVAILPVNHVVDGTDIAFRTGWGATLQTAVEAGRVAFEVDGYDADASSGWSVLVHGNATVVYEAEDQARLDGLAAKPWVQFGHQHFLGPDLSGGDKRPGGPAKGTPLRAASSGLR